MTALPRDRDHRGGDDDLEVRHVHPYEAIKTYRCPGCHNDIAPRTGHEVVVPRHAPELRRHWHSACWRIEQRRRTTAPDAPKRPRRDPR